LAELKKEVEDLQKLERGLAEIEEMAKEFAGDEKLLGELEEKIGGLEKEIGAKESEIFLSGKYDRRDALLEISAGAGGQDSEDWATMLWRLYQRFCERRGWKTKVLEQSFGEPGGPEGRIGTKSITLEIKSKNAYGLLKGEAGVHRLVRISPFSAQKLRHTSFAKVEVAPLIEDEKEIEIRPDDLKIDFFRASGPGGQNVNKVESSVRITHLPTGLVVACQTERSQSQNRQKAMKMLASKLIQLREGEREKEVAGLKGEKKSASWSNQTRNYVLHPYKLVKDLRTGVESKNPEEILDGKLDEFIEAEIRF
jgi:peptide chain release factor 2